MRKSQPTTRSSFGEGPDYRRGYEAGFEAGQRANRDQGVQQQINRFNNQPYSSTGGNQRSQSQDYKTNQNFGTNNESNVNKGTRPIKTGRLSNEYPSQRSFDKPTLTRDNQFSNQEYDITGKKLTSTRDNQFSNQEYDITGKKQTSTRDNRFPNQEHEVPGKTTNPETDVQFNARGHY